MTQGLLLDYRGNDTSEPGAALTARALASNYMEVLTMSKPRCAVDGCERQVNSRGWCLMHYKRWRRTGNPLGRAGIPPIERFDRLHNKGDDCWDWTGALDTNGYGIFSHNGANVGAHRWSYEHHHGPIEDGLVMDHLCRNRACVNPAHLEAVTNRENIRRGFGITAVNARKTQCPQGHEYNDDNTYRYEGRRYCKACVLRRQRDARAAR